MATVVADEHVTKHVANQKKTTFTGLQPFMKNKVIQI